jgi:molybdate transport system permease protein
MKSRTIRSPLGWLGGLLVVYLVVPVAAFLIRFAGSHDRGFGTPGLWSALRVSVLSASISTALIALFGIPLAYTLARSRSRLSALIGMAVQLPLALPPLMSGILLIYILGPYTTLGRMFHGRLTNSLAGVVFAQSFVAAPFLVIAARSAFASIDPAFDEVATTLGHGPLARFLQVSVPNAATGIGAGMLLTWLRAFGEYGATVLLAYHPYSLPVYTDVQFSGSGLFPTQAPTALALAVAAGAVALSRQRRPRRARRTSSLPAPRPPNTTEPTSVSFDLDVTVGTFRLQIAHHANSHRLAILGPSGSGKSLTLRSLAGLLGPGVGLVAYGNQTVQTVPTERRRIGYVPQHVALFPRRTVREQLLFATDADEQLAVWWLDTLHLRGLEDRFPDQLSGGQRQRVTLAQALSRNPRVVLLDEPFSSLDAPARDELRHEVRRLQHDAGLSTVLVTHDPEEAALLADEVVVIADGRLLQAGTREDVYSHPAFPQVARLLGMRNINPARSVAPTALSTGTLTIAVNPTAFPAGVDVLWCVRPEQIDISDSGRYPAQIVDVARLGAATAVEVRLDHGAALHIRTLKSIDLSIGAVCRIDIDPSAITVWAATSDPTWSDPTSQRENPTI